jgi:hypothetical protein
MNLGILLPQEIKDDFARRNIELGKTLLIEIPDFNISYKKYLIIVATSNSYIAGVVINTEINLNFAWSEEVKKLHLPIKQEEHPFLKYDSFVDCSKLHKRLITEICDAIKENPSMVIGNVTESLLRTLQITITHAKTISVKDKKEFGFL